MYVMRCSQCSGLYFPGKQSLPHIYLINAHNTGLVSRWSTFRLTPQPPSDYWCPMIITNVMIPRENGSSRMMCILKTISSYMKCIATLASEDSTTDPSWFCRQDYQWHKSIDLYVFFGSCVLHHIDYQSSSHPPKTSLWQSQRRGRLLGAP